MTHRHQLRDEEAAGKQYRMYDGPCRTFYSFDSASALHYINCMELEALSGTVPNMLRQQVVVSMLKKSMDFQQQAAMQLIQSLAKVQDPALGNNIDTYA
jgi:hypothetical protein